MSVHVGVREAGLTGLPSVELKGVDPRLIAFAKIHKLYVTCGTNGVHNVGSKHAKGEALDVRARDMSDAAVKQLAVLAREHGLRLLDERKRPVGQKVWSGSHIHLEVRQPGEGEDDGTGIEGGGLGGGVGGGVGGTSEAAEDPD